MGIILVLLAPLLVPKVLCSNALRQLVELAVHKLFLSNGVGLVDYMAFITGEWVWNEVHCGREIQDEVAHLLLF